MFDFDSDGDIDEFDEELVEYELKLMEDEMIFAEMEEKQYKEEGQEEDWGKYFGLGVLIALDFLYLFI